jgi:transposase
LRRRQIRHVIPQRTDQRARRRGKPGRPPLFDAAAYKRRNVVERCVANLKQFRALRVPFGWRYEKRAANYRALVVLAALLLWLRP